MMTTILQNIIYDAYPETRLSSLAAMGLVVSVTPSCGRRAPDSHRGQALLSFPGGDLAHRAPEPPSSAALVLMTRHYGQNLRYDLAKIRKRSHFSCSSVSPWALQLSHDLYMYDE